MMKRLQALVIILIASVLLAACTPGAAPGSSVTSTPEVTSPAPTEVATQPAIPDAAVSAQKDLAGKLGVDPAKVELVTIEEVEWPNACLGLPKAGEMCAEVITSGYRLVFKYQEKSYEYHTNQDGTQIRSAEDVSKGGPQNGQDPEAVTAAVNLLAQQLGVAAAQIKVVTYEAVDWPNGCLGVQMPGRLCTQVITPGYRVLLESAGKQYEFHTDQTGGAIFSAVAPLPETAGKVVVWEEKDGSNCNRVEIGPKSVAFGACGQALSETQLSSQRAEELAQLYAIYKPFSGNTKAGTVDFTGQGQQATTDAEMRSVAEWAKLVFMEAQGGRSSAAWGLAFSWHREGGIAGFCNDLGVYLNGWAVPVSCKAGGEKSFNPYRLSAEELRQLYQWIDTFQRFEFEQKDAASADSMTVRTIFEGTGTTKASTEQQQEIAQFAAQIYANAAQ